HTATPYTPLNYTTSKKVHPTTRFLAHFLTTHPSNLAKTTQNKTTQNHPTDKIYLSTLSVITGFFCNFGKK
ncbi:MAG: hypothetical protein K2J66_02595, partial [Muribaculaceae bacterium]|nr:hypothetical protein [Muribaculaceae bacterium]